MLYRTLSDPTCPYQLGESCVWLFRIASKQFRPVKKWEAVLRSTFLALGIKPELLGPNENDEMDVDASKPNLPFKQTMHTLRLVLEVIEILLTSAHVVDDEYVHRTKQFVHQR